MVNIIIIKKNLTAMSYRFKKQKDGKELKSLWMGKGRNNCGEKY